MKLIHISDTHVVEHGRLLYGKPSAESLERCVAHVNADHADAVLAVVSGDLVEDGTEAQYRCIRGILDRLAMPWRAIPGNHDARAAMAAALDGLPADGPMHQVVDLPGARLLLLDTLRPGEEWGLLGETQLDWLEARLAEADRPVLVFMHHPPILIGHQAMDDIRLRDDAAFLQRVLRSGKVRHVFFGHVHRPFSAFRAGIGYSSVAGTNHQVSLQGMASGELWASLEPPGYAFALVEDGAVAVHFQCVGEAAVFPF